MLTGLVIGVAAIVGGFAGIKSSVFAVSDDVSVSTCAELQALDDAPGNENKNIILTADLNCTGITFRPLFADSATFPDGFTGMFDGQGHSINNLTINRPTDDNVGVFSFAYGATIRHLTLQSGTIKGGNYVGGLVGKAIGVSVSDVHSAVNVTTATNGGLFVGGLLGYQTVDRDTVVEYSSSTGTIKGGFSVGGLIGQLDGAGSLATMTIRSSYATGSLKVDAQSGGGLIGLSMSSLVIRDSYTTADISSWSSSSNHLGIAGGLVGELYVIKTLTIARTYASGSVAASYNAGGLVGLLSGPYDDGSPATAEVSITDSFAAGQLSVDTGNLFGGIVGQASSLETIRTVTVTNVYYDEMMTGADNCFGDNSFSCQAVDTSAAPQYFKDNSTNPPLNSWNFMTVWQKNAANYPTLRPPAPDDGDGVESEVEEGAPNGGDGNGNGIPDSTESNVTSYINSVTHNYTTLVVPQVCHINTVATIAQETLATKDSGYKYPAGFMDFTLNCGTPGYQATIEQYYYGVNEQPYTLRKYMPHTNAYFTVRNAQLQFVTVGDTKALKVTYTVIDGGELDTDGMANGMIIDPVGLGVEAVGVPNTGLGGSQR